MNARRTLARPLLAVLALLVAVCALVAPTQAWAEDRSGGIYLRCRADVAPGHGVVPEVGKTFSYTLYVTVDDVPYSGEFGGNHYVDGCTTLTQTPGYQLTVPLPLGSRYTIEQTAEIGYDTSVDGVSGLKKSGGVHAKGGYETVTFQNTLNPAPAQFSPVGLTKTLTGGTLAAGAYEYKMVVTDDGAQVAERSAANAADGSIAFEAVDLASVGTYHVTVTELGDASTAGHSDNVLEMDVVVSQRGSSLVCESAVTSGSLTFAGTISPAPQPEPVTPEPEPTPQPEPAPTTEQPANKRQAKALPQTGDDAAPLAAVMAAGLAVLAVARILRRHA